MAIQAFNAMDRPSIALSNLIYGEPGASMRAMLAPQTLSPYEAQHFLERAGIMESDGPFSAVLRTITNPIVIVGAIAGMRYKVPTLENITKYSEQVQKAAGRFGPLGRMKSLEAIFQDKPEIADIWAKIFGGQNKFKETFMLRGQQAIMDFEKAAGRRFGQREELLLSATMRGLDDKVAGYRDLASPFNKAAMMRDMDAPLLQLRNEFRGMYDEIYNIMFGTEEKRKALEGALSQRGLSLGDFKEQYLPNLLVKDALSIKQQQQMLSESISLGVGEKDYGRRMVSNIHRFVSLSAAKRRYRMLPDPRQLMDLAEQFPEYVNVKAVREIAKQVDKNPHVTLKFGEDAVLALPAVYDLRFKGVFENYVNGMAGTYGWTLNGYGKKLQNWVGKLQSITATSGDKARANLLSNTYIPIAKGVMTQNQAIAAQQWGSVVHTTMDVLKRPKIKEMLGKIPGGKRMADWMLDVGAHDRGPLGLTSVSGEAAGWLYLSTLGANVGSATLNLLQTFLTTVPMIGSKATMAGMGRVYQKSKKYFALRGQGVIHEEALAQAFPDFAEMGLSATPITDDAMRATFKYSWDQSGMLLPQRYGSGMDRMKRAMMALFSYTEQFNRLTAFEGAMWKGAREGMKGEPLREAARKIVAKTQFLGGPETTPAFLVDKNPLVRQYLMFPSKMLEFLFNTATTAGSGAQAGFMGRNWGTLGRAMAISGGIYEMGQGLGLDLSTGLATGSLPLPQDAEGPFGVFPFVPPVFQLGGSLVQAAITGEADPLKRSATMLVPGGIAAGRVAGFIPGVGSPTIGKFLGRHYADYDYQTPDGRVAVYSQNGSLVGFETLGQIVAKGLGIPGGGGEMRSEANAIPWLLKNRERILQARREYLHAMQLNDTQAMMRIRENFERAYRIPLTIKQEHIKAAQLRRMVPRLERVLNTLPADVRPQFAAMVQNAILSEGSQFLGMDPQLLSQGNPQSRMASRTARFKGQSPYQRSGTYQQNMGPLSSGGFGGIGRNQLPEVGVQGGLAFGGF